MVAGCRLLERNIEVIKLHFFVGGDVDAVLIFVVIEVELSLA